MKIENLDMTELAQRLVLTVINYVENEERLSNFPVVKKGSFALLTQLCVGEMNAAGQYTACLTVTNDILEQWDITKEEMFEMAINNSKKLFPSTYQAIEKYMDAIQLKEPLMLPDNVEASQVLVLTNEQYFNGAATIFYEPEILDEIAAKLHSETVMLLPSSINEVYCLPARSKEEEQEYQEIFAGLSDILCDESLHIQCALTYNSRHKDFMEIDGTSYTADVTQPNMNKQGYGR